MPVSFDPDLRRVQRGEILPRHTKKACSLDTVRSLMRIGAERDLPTMYAAGFSSNGRLPETELVVTSHISPSGNTHPPPRTEPLPVQNPLTNHSLFGF